MIEIDGSFGEGGGQILRTSLSLSALSGLPFRIFNLRKARQKPGLRAQHLACVRAAKQVCGARCEGDTIGSLELTFEPGQIKPGPYSFNIGTAGSTMLVFQTLVPILSAADQASEVILTGGTHNPMSPPFDFVKECFRPMVEQLGVSFEIELIRPGFYPRGGGEVRAEVHPGRKVEKEKPLSMDSEVDWGEPEVEIILANLPMHIAERERDEIMKSLRISQEHVKFKFPPGECGPGNVVLIRYQAFGRTEIFTGFGEKGKRAESVARDASRDAKNFSKSRAALDARLADQILLYLAIGPGGRFLTNQITEHLRTNIHVIQKFKNLFSEIQSLKPDLFRVSISG
jgi:RNA 3'-terminal phosphate cyclase (ATP)